MRLLQRLPCGTYELASFDDDHPPPYAILSHTWEAGQELSYQELVAGAGGHKKGFEKIRFCCERAEADRLQYFWVDTCCIDKTNNSELDTAINYMFRWYQRSSKCYVYLSDVSVGDHDPATFPILWADAFRRSRWFTRGWTLQELIAPDSVEFFSSEGKRLGSKITLEHRIHDITRIPISALRGLNLAEFSVEERMSWVASRVTTMKEDQAYCLFGIFGVFLPVIYGEGEEHAMRRLRMEIREQQQELEAKQTSSGSHDRQQLQTTRPSLAIPFRRDPDFVDRGTLLNELKEQCSAPAARVALVGVGGVGKSQLVIEHCYRTAERSPKTWVFWVDASNATRFALGFRDIADSVKIEGRQDPRVNIFKLVHDWLCDSKTPWLLVLDGMNDARFLVHAPIGNREQSARDSGMFCQPLRDYLPHCERGSMIITTRNRKVALELVDQRDIVAVEPMSEEDAMALLHTTVTFGESDRADAQALVHVLERNPLAIMEAAVYIKTRAATATIASYLKLFRESEAYNIEQDDDRLSVQSVESSTTLVSTFSGLTVVEKSATVELERIFQEDAELNNLYRVALKDASMEPDKLQRNIARLLQFFAKDLRREAGGDIERVASRFVQSKAQYIAQCIVEKFHDTPRDSQRPHIRVQEKKGDENGGKQGEDRFEVVEAQLQVDDVDDVAPVDEDYFEDLAMLRKFLLCSSAFQIFQARLTKFVLPKDLRRLDLDSVVTGRSIKAPFSRFRHFWISTSRILKDVLVAAGCLEPPLQPGFIRLRWQCDCGAPLFGDVQEYRIGGVSRLMERMERSINGKVTATSYGKGSSQERYIPGPIFWVREAARDFASSFSRDVNRSDMLPRHSGPNTTVTPAPVNLESPLAEDLLLLACVHQSQGGQFLRQDSIGAVGNDRQLFYFIREQLSRTLNERRPSLLLKRVTGIHFTQSLVSTSSAADKIHVSAFH
ncbi:hypothetical protein GRF29_8g2559841 [Pseudopithomyces chartarum]|uniref:Heterokaryon incompatibility domain-containing protein n=1 Tax=Pseudopithomyces chartarum TaxID=1892770 RepID=A0AAN6M8A3_9PLEO|nr:hypothetical protein GRF29_8g2559841 [Pseudopithomyces chartarum]